jgi:serine-type D-Ala-D-Ala carboxypeptidase/endopeptidase (penicillin-binding protein 4)
MTLRRRIAAVLLYVVCSANVCVAQTAAGKPASKPTPSIQTKLAAIVGQFESSKTGGPAGVSVREISTGKSLYAYRATEAFIPASNQKLLGAIFWLEKKSHEGTFQTEVYRRGDELLIVGDFDPLLGDPYAAKREKKSVYAEVDAWGAAAKEAGMTKISRVLVMNRLGGVYPPTWLDRYKPHDYGAPVASASFYYNCYGVTFVKTASGKLVPDVTPTSGRFIRVVDQVKTGSRHVFSIRGENDESVLTVRGTAKVAGGDVLLSPCKNPRIRLARVVAGRLDKAGLKVAAVGEVAEADAEKTEWTKLATTTRSGATVLKESLQHSFNLAAECVVLNAGGGTFAASAKAMTTTLTTTFKLKPGALTVADGSGLSRENAVTPEAMTTVLSGATTRCYWELLCGAMAKSGESGTLKKRMTDIAGRIVAKTGYINGVSCLSGYLLDKPGGKPIYSFSILTRDIRSGADAKKFQDSLCRQLLTHLDAK